MSGYTQLTREGVDADPESPMNHLLGSTMTYRIAVGPQQGRKVFTLQTLPDCRPDNPFVDTLGKVAGFSLHVGVAIRAHERDKLERVCRYIARPAVSTQRLALTGHACGVRAPIRETVFEAVCAQPESHAELVCKPAPTGPERGLKTYPQRLCITL